MKERKNGDTVDTWSLNKQFVLKCLYILFVSWYGPWCLITSICQTRFLYHLNKGDAIGFNVSDFKFIKRFFLKKFHQNWIKFFKEKKNQKIFFINFFPENQFNKNRNWENFKFWALSKEFYFWSFIEKIYNNKISLKNIKKTKNRIEKFFIKQKFYSSQNSLKKIYKKNFTKKNLSKKKK